MFQDDDYKEESITDSPSGQGLRALLDELRSDHSSFVNLYILTEEDSNGPNWVTTRLIEDEGKSFGFKMNYYDFYCTYLKGTSKVF